MVPAAFNNGLISDEGRALRWHDSRAGLAARAFKARHRFEYVEIKTWPVVGI